MVEWVLGLGTFHDDFTHGLSLNFVGAQAVENSNLFQAESDGSCHYILVGHDSCWGLAIVVGEVPLYLNTPEHRLLLDLLWVCLHEILALATCWLVVVGFDVAPLSAPDMDPQKLTAGVLSFSGFSVGLSSPVSAARASL
jgi:hypothetical protein